MTRLTRAAAVAQLIDGVKADLGAATCVRGLLEAQFAAALRHRAAELAALAEELMPQLEAMEQRRAQRVQLVRALFGAQASMDTLFASLAEPQRAASVAAWAHLEQLVLDCKAATVRNQTLMAEQHSTMQRVLHGEDQTYAPA